MSIKKIKKIATQSYFGNELNKKTVDEVSTKLSRKELKTYIKYLKEINNKSVLRVYSPSRKIITDDIRRSLKRFFPDRDIFIIEDESLIAGLRIVDNDTIYELNLKDSFENIMKYIENSYD